MKFFRLCLTAALVLPIWAQPAPQIVEGVSAIVSDNIILKSDVAQIVNMTAIQQKIYPDQSPELFQKLEAQVLQSLIEQKVVLEMAKLDSITVKDKDVDAALEQQIQNIISQAGSEAKAEEMLGQPLKKFKRDYWFDIHDRLITEQYQQKLIAKIKTNRNDVETFFKTYKDSIPTVPTLIKLRHLLVPITASEERRLEALAFLNSVRDSIVAGGDFATYAKKYSQDPGSKSRGGSLGFVRRGSLVKEFEEAAFTLNINEISEPVETIFGYHLIQPLEKQGDKIRVRHILWAPQIQEEDETRAYNFAVTLKDSAKSIADFKALVSRHSTDDRTASIGGDLGWINPVDYPIPEFSKVIPYLEINRCSLPVKTGYGYHLLWMESLKPGGKPNLKDHWTQIEMMALNHKKMTYYENWLKKSRDKFFIRVMN